LRLREMYGGPDTEKAAAASVDYLETRSDVDSKRIGMMAVSLGGYYAPRAAAFEKRFKCAIAWERSGTLEKGLPRGWPAREGRSPFPIGPIN